MKKLTLVVSLILVLSSTSSAEFTMYDDFSGVAGQCDGTKWTGEYVAECGYRPVLDGIGAVRMVESSWLKGIEKFALPQPVDIDDFLTIEFAVKKHEAGWPSGTMYISALFDADPGPEIYRADLYCGATGASTCYAISSKSEVFFPYTQTAMPLPDETAFDQVRMVLKNDGTGLRITWYIFNESEEWQPFTSDKLLYELDDPDWSPDVTFYISSSAGRSDFDYVQYEYTSAGPVLLVGDANRDGVVSAGDYMSVQSNFGDMGALGIPGDADGNGIVSASDYASVQANFGNVTSAVVVPEPVTLSLLGIGGVVMIRRRPVGK